MNAENNKLDRAQAASAKIQEKLEELSAKMNRLGEEAFNYKQRAIEEFNKGNTARANQLFYLHKLKSRNADMILRQMQLVMNDQMRMNAKIQRLVINKVPEEYRSGVDVPNVNVNNNSLEQKYLPKNNKNNNSNVETNTVCNKLGRCIRRFITRGKNKNNKNKKSKGGKRKTRKMH